MSKNLAPSLRDNALILGKRRVGSEASSAKGEVDTIKFPEWGVSCRKVGISLFLNGQCWTLT